MLNLSLKQAETALKKGQLDEAFSLLRDGAARATRPAQELTVRLVTALVCRGNEHLVNGRVAAAASDAAKAVRLGGQQADVVELFEAVEAAKASQQKQRKQEQDLLHQARREIDRGVGTVGERILQRANPDKTAVKQLARELGVRREINDAELNRARVAIDRDQPEKALDVLIGLKRTQPDHPEVADEIVRAVAPIASSLRNDLRVGRIDRVLIWQSRLESLRCESTDATELVEVMKRCRRAKALIDQSRHAEADRELGLLHQMIPDAAWVTEARELLSGAVSTLARLQSGPIGLIDGRCEQAVVGPVPPVTIARDEPKQIQRFADSACETPSEVPSRMLLQVDGMTSVLLLSSATVRIGSASRSESMDIPLMTDGVTGAVEVHRAGDDYLLTSEAPLLVNGRSVTRRLLAHGDVISIGRRGRIRFSKPIAASATAILDLTGASMGRSDIRRIALFADALVIGRDQGSHLPVRGAQQRFALHPSGGAMAIRSVGGGVGTKVCLGQSVVVDDIRLRITDFDDARSPGPTSLLPGGRKS